MKKKYMFCVLLMIAILTGIIFAGHWLNIEFKDTGIISPFADNDYKKSIKDFSQISILLPYGAIYIGVCALACCFTFIVNGKIKPFRSRGILSLIFSITISLIIISGIAFMVEWNGNGLPIQTISIFSYFMLFGGLLIFWETPEEP